MPCGYGRRIVHGTVLYSLPVIPPLVYSICFLNTTIRDTVGTSHVHYIPHVLMPQSSLVRSQLVSLEFFIHIKSFRSHFGPGVDSDSNRTEHQEQFPGGKGDRCVRLPTLPPSCAAVMKSGNFNFLEPSGPLQACNGIVLLFNATERRPLHRKVPNTQETPRNSSIHKRSFPSEFFCFTMIMVTTDNKIASRIISNQGTEIIPCIIHDLSLIFTKSRPDGPNHRAM